MLFDPEVNFREVTLHIILARVIYGRILGDSKTLENPPKVHREGTREIEHGQGVCATLRKSGQWTLPDARGDGINPEGGHAPKGACYENSCLKRETKIKACGFEFSLICPHTNRKHGSSFLGGRGREEEVGNCRRRGLPRGLRFIIFFKQVNRLLTQKCITYIFLDIPAARRSSRPRDQTRSTAAIQSHKP